ncbi:SOS response-associated peptidase [soil metagenome]
MCAVDKIVIAGDNPVSDAFGLEEPIAPVDQFNFPMRDRPVIRQNPDGQRELTEMNWGLVPYWAKEKKVGRMAYNARMESLIEGKPTFREAFKKRKCLLIGTSYIEHREEDGKMVTYEFSVEGGEPYAYAGLWETWKDGFLSTAMITTIPNELVEIYHDRMPVILRSEDYATWLDPTSDPVELLALLQPFPAERMTVQKTTLPPRTKSSADQLKLFD